jgi:ankyrin repeat protein
MVKSADVDNLMSGGKRTFVHTFLRRASRSPLPRLAAHMLIASALISLAGCKTLSPIEAAARYGDLEGAKVLLQNNPDLALSKDKDGDTALHYAGFGYESHKNVAELLVAHRADVNAKDNNGVTPLLVAAHWGHRDVAELLLAHGADVNAKDTDGNTPLHVAAYYSDIHSGCKAVMELLLANKADVHARNNDGYTPWHFVADNFLKKDAAELLRQHGGQD